MDVVWGLVCRACISCIFQRLDTSYNLSSRKTTPGFMSISPIPYVDSLPTRRCSDDTRTKWAKSAKRRLRWLHDAAGSRILGPMGKRSGARAGKGPRGFFSMKQPETNVRKEQECSL